MAQLWKLGYARLYDVNPYINPVNEIVFKRHECEWVLPLSLAKHLFSKSNPNHLPVVQHYVEITAEYTVIWEIGGTKNEFDRILLSVGRSNEEYYLRLAIVRIERGHRAWTPTPLPLPSPFTHEQP